MDPIRTLKELHALAVTRKELSKVDWKHGIIPGLVSLLTTSVTLYASFKGLLSPQYAFGAAVAISGLYLVLEAVLRAQHKPALPVDGVPATTVAALVALLESKYPDLKKSEQMIQHATELVNDVLPKQQ